MAKSALTVLLLLVLIVLSPFIVSTAESKADLEITRFVLPCSLEEVEDEAFEGISVKTVLFQNKVISIGHRAFANVSNLRDIYVPPSIKSISEHAFPENKGLTIHGVKGSYAEDWAKEHQVPFKVSNIWNLILVDERPLDVHVILHESIIQAIKSNQTTGVNPQTAYNETSMRPQDRPELNPIDYRFP